MYDMHMDMAGAKMAYALGRGGGGGGVRALFLGPPPFWAPVTGTPDGLTATPDGLTGEVGGGGGAEIPQHK